jgi:hypothetical protein
MTGNGKPERELELRASATGMPGEFLEVAVSLRPRKDMSARQVRVELIGKELEYQRLRGGHQHSGAVEKRRINTFSRTVSVLQEECNLREGVPERWGTFIQVPDDAPPSCKGEVVDVNWAVRAVVDVPRRSDLATEAPVQVLAAPVAPGENAIADRAHKQCDLGLEFPRQAAAGGRQIEGRLRLTANDTFAVRGIRVELVTSEQAGIKGELRKIRKTRVREQLEGPGSLNTQDTRSYRFALDAPSSGMVTMQSPKSSLRWLVRATVDRRMRQDLKVEGTIHIHNTPTSVGE